MATQTLVATLCNPAAADVINSLGTPTVITPGNTVAFPNFPGQTLLFVAVGGTGGTVQTNIGVTLFGQSFAPFATVAVTASTNYILGPFHSALAAPGSNIVTVTTSGALVSSMLALQVVGVY